MLQLVVEARIFLVMVVEMVQLRLLQLEELLLTLTPGLHQEVQMLQRQDYQPELTQ
ncbi:hypothetical protein D3C80_1103830 [compost metagenome]